MPASGGRGLRGKSGTYARRGPAAGHSAGQTADFSCSSLLLGCRLESRTVSREGGRHAQGRSAPSRGPFIRTVAGATGLALTPDPWMPALAWADANSGVLARSIPGGHQFALCARVPHPAAVGTGAATALIRDGQIVEVDGSAGLVAFVSPA